MAKRKNDPAADSGAAHFEDSLTRLEAIIEAMENDQLPLEELVKHYEQGSVLLRQCDSFLRSARERIELITLNATSPSAETNDPVRSTASPSAGSEDNQDDDIRLF